MEKLSNNHLSAEEQTLWSRVNELWRCSLERDLATINEAIHPNYKGWDDNSLVPHGRRFAIHSITDNSNRLLDYKLFPLGVTVYEHKVGITNYRYRANIRDQQENVRAIMGRWTEIYMRKNNEWTLIGVHGGSESLKVISSADVY